MATVQTMWAGKSLSPIAILCLKSFLHKGHSVVLYTYEKVINLPEGVQVINANCILPKSEIFKINKSISFFSDYFRAKLLYENGGIWVDTDMFCLKRFDFIDDVVLGYQEAGIVCNAVMKLPKGHIIAKDLLSRIQNPWSYKDIRLFPPDTLVLKIVKKFPGDLDEVVKNLIKARGEKYVKKLYYLYSDFGAIAGPIGLSFIVKQHSLNKVVKSTHVFYPVHYTEWWSVFYDSKLQNTLNLNETFGLHLWHSSVDRYIQKYDKFQFQEGSLISELSKNLL